MIDWLIDWYPYNVNNPILCLHVVVSKLHVACLNVSLELKHQKLSFKRSWELHSIVRFLNGLTSVIRWYWQVFRGIWRKISRAYKKPFWKFNPSTETSRSLPQTLSTTIMSECSSVYTRQQFTNSFVLLKSTLGMK